jgi:hypothetical protein
MSSRVLEPVQDVFRAVATTVVPEAATFGDEEWRALEAIVDRTLAGRPPELQKQLVKFLRLIELWPLPRRASRFTRLAPRKRAAVLKSLQDSRITIIRRGFWGLRTLIFMGYYARPEAAAALGYRATAAGWSARRVPNATPSEAHPALQPAVTPATPVKSLEQPLAEPAERSTEPTVVEPEVETVERPVAQPTELPVVQPADRGDGGIGDDVAVDNTSRGDHTPPAGA